MAHFPILAMYGEMYGKSLPFAQRRFDSQSGACHAPRSGCGALGRPNTHPGPGPSALGPNAQTEWTTNTETRTVAVTTTAEDVWGFVTSYMDRVLIKM